jgi:hypothetical protein
VGNFVRSRRLPENFLTPHKEMYLLSHAEMSKINRFGHQARENKFPRFRRSTFREHFFITSSRRFEVREVSFFKRKIVNITNGTKTANSVKRIFMLSQGRISASRS